MKFEIDQSNHYTRRNKSWINTGWRGLGSMQTKGSHSSRESKQPSTWILSKPGLQNLLTENKYKMFTWSINVLPVSKQYNKTKQKVVIYENMKSNWANWINKLTRDSQKKLLVDLPVELRKFLICKFLIWEVKNPKHTSRHSFWI